MSVMSAGAAAPTFRRRSWGVVYLLAGPLFFACGAALSASAWRSALALVAAVALAWEARRQLSTEVNVTGVRQRWFIGERRIDWPDLRFVRRDVTGRLYLRSSTTRIDIDTRGLVDAEAVVQYCSARLDDAR